MCVMYISYVYFVCLFLVFVNHVKISVLNEISVYMWHTSFLDQKTKKTSVLP